MSIADVRALASGLAHGEQVTGILCPYCQGGHSKERTFSIKREKIIVKFICHRGSCGQQGEVLIVGAYLQPAQIVKKPYIMAPKLKPLNDAQYELLLSRFGFSKDECIQAPWLWDNDKDRLWLPIHNLRQTDHLGYTLRSFQSHVKRKALTIVDSQTEPVADWNIRDSQSKTLIIVEDQLSARKVYRQFNCVALLGTHLSEALVRQIKIADFNTIVLCLDKDAFSTGLKHKKRYDELFAEFIVKQPQIDLKYLSNEEIKTLVTS